RDWSSDVCSSDLVYRCGSGFVAVTAGLWRCERITLGRYSPPCITAAERKRASTQPQEKEGRLRHQENIAKPPNPTQPGWFSSVFSIRKSPRPRGVASLCSAMEPVSGALDLA